MPTGSASRNSGIFQQIMVPQGGNRSNLVPRPCPANAKQTLKLGIQTGGPADELSPQSSSDVPGHGSILIKFCMIHTEKTHMS